MLFSHFKTGLFLLDPTHKIRSSETLGHSQLWYDFRPSCTLH
uniref:Uncharacterized protein n=1 Tax=Rhizophora mucronata TaxID=61149 RepID=A0A2P2LJ53_RHIMU